MPIAIINTAADPQNSVSADHRGGGALVAAHILEIGHKRVVILGGDMVSEVQRDRIRGMSDVLGDAVCDVVWGAAGTEQAVAAVQAGATAILTTSDLLALSVRTALIRSDLSVPDDVSLTGFDDMSFAPVMHPALTTVAQNVDEITTRAIDIVLAKIRGDPHPLDGKTVPMRLVVRHSTSIATQPAKRRYSS